MKFVEAIGSKYVRLQELKEPFEGVYIGPVKGKFGTHDYRFQKDEEEIIMVGVTALHRKMPKVPVGHMTRIKFLGKKEMDEGKPYFDASVHFSETPANQMPSDDEIEFEMDLTE